MPNITGTNGNDSIDVTNDSGTLNGTPQGTPIDNIRARGGDDTISVTDSTIANDLRGNGGSDNIAFSGSTVTGVLSSGADADTVSVSSSTVGNIRLGGGNDTLNFISTSVTGDVRGGGGTDTLNLPVGTMVDDNTFGTFAVAANVSYSLSSGTFTLPSGAIVTYTAFENGTGFPCFTRGTHIETLEGKKSVEQLKVGDTIVTQDRKNQQIRWIGSRKFDAIDFQTNPKLRPIRILAGALGNGLPTQTLSVSRQHRMLVRSKIAKRMFGEIEVLVPAIKLTALPGISIDENTESVEYFHLLFDNHEIIFAENAPTESLFIGPEAVKSLNAEAVEEIHAIFPEVADLDYKQNPVRFIPPGKLQKQLIARHLKNSQPLIRNNIQRIDKNK